MNSVAEALHVLGLESGASSQEIKEAYHDLCAVWHPDKHQGNERRRLKAEEMMKQINAAYDFLRRRDWDTTTTKTGGEQAGGGDGAGSSQRASTGKTHAESQPYEAGPIPRCPQCDHVLFQVGTHCPVCGLPLLGARLVMTAKHKKRACYECWLRSRYPVSLQTTTSSTSTPNPKLPDIEVIVTTTITNSCPKCGWSQSTTKTKTQYTKEYAATLSDRALRAATLERRAPQLIAAANGMFASFALIAGLLYVLGAEFLSKGYHIALGWLLFALSLVVVNELPHKSYVLGVWLLASLLGFCTHWTFLTIQGSKMELWAFIPVSLINVAILAAVIWSMPRWYTKVVSLLTYAWLACLTILMMRWLELVGILS